MNNVDKQYLDIMQDIIDNGVWKNTRSGSVKSVFGRTMRFNLQEGLPLLTTKKVYTKGIIHELLWFLSGNTNIKYLIDNNVNIWNDDAYRWFKSLNFPYLNREKPYYDDEDDKMRTNVYGYYKLEHCIFDLEDDIENAYAIVINDDFENEIPTSIEELKDLTKEQFVDYVKQGAWLHRYDIYEGRNVSDRKIYVFGDLGEVYGKQWRSFGVSGKDQIQNIIDTLKTNPDDRRMILTGWNPDVLDTVALPACHIFSQFYTRELSNQERFTWLQENSNNKYDEWKSASDETLDKLNVPKRALSCAFTMRSNDFCCGNPYNVTSYSILCYIIANICNMVPEELIYNGGDIHIYENQFEGCQTQLQRKGSDKLPKFIIKRNLADINQINFDDFEIINYYPDDTIKFPLSVG